MAAAPSSLGTQISEELTCSICLELFTRPKVLPCQHTFCQDCLQDLAGWETTFQCPNCRQQVELPPQGVAGLPDNRLVTSLCERLQNQATLSGETGEQPQSGNRCSFHPTEVLRMYCKQCQMPVCEQCIEEAHDGHRTTTIKKAAQERISTVQALINEGRNILESYCSFLRNLGEKERRLNEKKQQTDNDIIQSYYALLAEAEENHRKDLAKIQTERDRVLADVNELSAACDQAEQEMQEGGVDFLSQETILTEVVGKYRGKTAPIPVQTQPAVFQPTDTPVLALGHVLGLVTVPESVSSSPSQAASASTVPNSTQEGHHRVETFAREGSDVDTSDITSLLFPPINDELLQVFSGKNKKKRTRTRRKALTTSNIATEGTGYHPDNQRQDGFQPADNPELALGHATVQSLSSKPMIAPRPRNVAARGTGHHPGNQMQGNHRPLQNVTFGGLGSGTGQFNSPLGVTVSDKEIFVVDCENYRIQVFTLQGIFVRQFPTVVSGEEEMYPHDVAMDVEGNLWVVGNTESAEFAVQYTKQGRVWRKLNLQKTGRHRGVAVDTRRKHILITQITGDEENLNGEVLVFRPDGTLVRTVGQQQGMVYPWYITVDGEGNILVSDWSNHCVYVYNEDGQFLFWFGGEGSGEGQLLNPHGICTDRAGNIIVADSGNRRVEMFDKRGKFLKHIAMDMEKPQAVAMATQGQLVVSDAVCHTVTIFQTI